MELGTNELTTNAKQQLFAYPSCFVLQQPTALQGHFLGGYNSGKNKTATDTPAAVPNTGSVPGFSGFGHATDEATAAAPVASTGPIFFGFGHATGEMGGTQSLMGQSFVASADAPVAAAPVGPIFSGFRHATGQMGGNPSLTSAPASVPNQVPAPASSVSYL